MAYIYPFLKSSLYALMLSSIYYFYGYSQNQSYGYGQIRLDGDYVLIFILAVFFGAYLFSKKYKKPSDYFLLIYGMVVVMPFALLHDIYDKAAAVGLVGVVLPFFGVMLLCKFDVKLPLITVVLEDRVLSFVFFFCVFVILILLLNPPVNASFSLSDIHLRRLESRDNYGSRTFISYAASIVMNSMLPLLVFLGCARGRISLILASVLIYLCFYYIYGVKAPLLYMVFAGMVACGLKMHEGEIKFYNFIYYSFLLLFSLAWVEFYFFNYSYLEDYLIRRVFYVGSYLVGVYAQVIVSAESSFVSGLLVGKAASIYVGEDFLRQPGLNANTNTFLYFFLQFGIFGYFFSIFLVSVVLAVLDSLRARSDVFLLVSLIFSGLILEQSVTTVLVSSGVGTLILLLYFSHRTESN